MLSLPLLAALAASTATGAQTLDPTEPPPASHAAALAAPVAKVHYSQQPDGLWAAGRNYKVQASASGLTYFPFLGPDAERTWPVTFRLAEATLGGTELPLNRSALVTRTEDRIVLDRGPVDVAYDMEPEQIEQSFLVDAAGATGDLVLDLEITTDLSGRGDGAGFRFDSEAGGVLYGAAIVLDGTGRQAEVDAVLDGRHLRLTVSSDFLGTAVGPVVVDPVIRTWTVDERDMQQLYPDVSYDTASETFMYVYETGLTAADTDIFFRTIDLDGNLIDSGYIYLGGDPATEPAIANVSDSATCLCVYTRERSTGLEVWGRLRKMQSGDLSSDFLISLTSTVVDGFGADVGGSALPGGRFLVAWTRQLPGGDLRIRTRTVFTGGSLGNSATSASDPTSDLDCVAVSQSVGEAGDAGYWNVIYRGTPTVGSTNQQIRGMQFNADGSVRETDKILFTETAGIEISDLDVSDTIAPRDEPPTYLTVYTRRDGTENDTWFMTCRDNQALFRRHLQALEHSRIERAQFSPHVTTTRDEFIVSYLELRPASFNLDVFVTSLDLVEDRCAVSERRTFLGDTGAANAGGCAIASRFASGLFTSRWSGYGWSRWDTVGSTTSFNVLGGVLLSSLPRAIGMGFQDCVGTENSTGDRGFIIVQGDQSIDQPKTLVAGSLPFLTFGYFIVGDGLANIPMAGGSAGTLCVGGAIGRYSNFVMNTGVTGTLELVIDPTILPTPAGSESATVGMVRRFQTWYRDTDGTGQATSNFTNAATVVFR